MEPNKDMSLENKKSFIALENRKKMTLDGVLEILSFNDDCVGRYGYQR